MLSSEEIMVVTYMSFKCNFLTVYKVCMMMIIFELLWCSSVHQHIQEDSCRWCIIKTIVRAAAPYAGGLMVQCNVVILVTGFGSEIKECRFKFPCIMWGEVELFLFVSTSWVIICTRFSLHLECSSSYTLLVYLSEGTGKDGREGIGHIFCVAVRAWTQKDWR